MYVRGVADAEGSVVLVVPRLVDDEGEGGGEGEDDAHNLMRERW